MCHSQWYGLSYCRFVLNFGSGIAALSLPLSQRYGCFHFCSLHLHWISTKRVKWHYGKRREWVTEMEIRGSFSWIDEWRQLKTNSLSKKKMTWQALHIVNRSLTVSQNPTWLEHLHQTVAFRLNSSQHRFPLSIQRALPYLTTQIRFTFRFTQHHCCDSSCSSHLLISHTYSETSGNGWINLLHCHNERFDPIHLSLNQFSPTFFVIAEWVAVMLTYSSA